MGNITRAAATDFKAILIINFLGIDKACALFRLGGK
jgi:hypothetical protein